MNKALSIIENFWIATVEDSLGAGWESELIPTSELREQTAIQLAVRLNVSLTIQGNNYLFKRKAGGTLVNMGVEVRR